MRPCPKGGGIVLGGEPPAHSLPEVAAFGPKASGPGPTAFVLGKVLKIAVSPAEAGLPLCFIGYAQGKASSPLRIPYKTNEKLAGKLLIFRTL